MAVVDCGEHAVSLYNVHCIVCKMYNFDRACTMQFGCHVLRSLHCVYNVHFSGIYTVQCTLHCVYNVHCLGVQCALVPVRTMYIARPLVCAMYIFSGVYSVHCTMYIALSVQCTLYCLYNEHYTVCTMYIVRVCKMYICTATGV